MKLTQAVLEELSKAEASKAEQDIKDAFNAHLEKLGFEGIRVDDVSTENGGDAIIRFVDDEDNELEVLFTYDNEDGADAYILDDNDYSDYENDEVSLEAIDLDPIDPKIITIDGEKTLDLVNLDWLTDDVLISILDSDEEIEEKRFAYVVRNGKRVKIAMVRRRRPKRITGKQRAAFRKAARKRKLKARSIARKRKKSLRVRKRMKVKKVTGRNKMLIRK